MQQIRDLEDILEEYAKKQEPHMDLVQSFLSSLKNIDKPLSVFSTFSFLPRVESIRAAIFETAKIDDIYTSKILYRSLIEHWVKFQYLFLRTTEENDDAIGIDYWLFGQAQENLDFAKSVGKIKQQLGLNDNKLPIELLKELGGLPNEISNRQIQLRLDQFKYKYMTDYLVDNYSDALDENGLRWFYDVFPRFSLLSSYVHGGPDAITNNDPLEDDLLSIINDSILALLWVRQFSYIMLYQYDRRFGELVNLAREYGEVISRYNKAVKSTATT